MLYDGYFAVETKATIINWMLPGHQALKKSDLYSNVFKCPNTLDTMHLWFISVAPIAPLLITVAHTSMMHFVV